MFKFFKRLFCKHNFSYKELVATRYEATGDKCRIYRCVCSKCGKELDIDSSSSCTYDDNGNLLCLDCYFAENDQIGDIQE